MVKDVCKVLPKIMNTYGKNASYMMVQDVCKVLPKIMNSYGKNVKNHEYLRKEKNTSYMMVKDVCKVLPKIVNTNEKNTSYDGKMFAKSCRKS